MDTTNMTTLTGVEVDPFIKNYREALAAQQQTSLDALNQERQNQQASIMANANSRGLMYSNFPARTKIQYDTNTYYPALQQVNTTYRTGLDTIRDNITNNFNNIANLKQQIAHLNSLT